MVAVAYEDAAGLYERAIDLLGRSADTSTRRRCELLLGQADALSRAGRGQDSRAVVAEATALARQLDEPRLLGQAALVLAGRRTPTTSGRTSRTLASLLEEAADALAGDPSSMRAEILLRLAMERHFDASAQESFLALQAEARAIVDRLGDARLDLLVRWTSMGRAHDPHEILAAAEVVVEKARLADQLELELLGSIACVGYRTQAGDLGGAVETMDAYAELIADLDLPQYHWWSSLWVGSRALLEGRIDDAGAAIDASNESGIASQGMGAIVQLWFQRVVLHLLTDQPFDGLVEEFDLFNDYSSDAARQDPLGIWLRWRAGRDDEVGSGLDVLAARGFDMTRDGNWLLFTGLMAEAAAGVGHARAAAALHPVLEPFSGCYLSLGFGATPFGSVDHVLGKLAVVSGRPDDAERSLRSALQSFEANGAHPWTAACAADLAALVGEPEASALRARATTVGQVVERATGVS
jgi:hypothetical protein